MPTSNLVPGRRVGALAELGVGDLLFDGSETAAGEPNLVLVTALGGAGDDHFGSRGFEGHFVALDDPSRLRLPSDRTFFVWDFELRRRGYRRAVSAETLRLESAAPRGRPSPLAGRTAAG